MEVSTKSMVFGAVGNKVWSCAGSSERANINQMRRMFAIGEQKGNATLQSYWNAVKPDDAGDRSLRAPLLFLVPRQHELADMLGVRPRVDPPPGTGIRWP
jgi:hypothetical protein